LSSEILEAVAEAVSKSRVSGRHTFYQLKHFVLGKEVTTQAKMWKCLRELEARLIAAKSMKAGIEDSEDECRVMEIRAEVLEKKKTKGRLHREYKEIQRRKLGRKKESLMDSICEMKRRLAETEEEMGFFLGAYRQLEAIEPLRSHDDPEANAHYWDQNFAQEMQLRMMFQKPLDLELIKSILALDDRSSTRKELVGMIEQIQRQAISASESRRLDNKDGGN
jgi:hypothetical protein